MHLRRFFKLLTRPAPSALLAGLFLAHSALLAPLSAVPCGPVDAHLGEEAGSDPATANGAIDPGETDPNDPHSHPGGEHFVVDSDCDGLPDEEETRKWFTNPYDADSDDDGISDYDEVNGTGPLLRVRRYYPAQMSTDPTNPDTDYDGIPDGTEGGVTEPLLGPDGLLDTSLETSDGTFIGSDQEPAPSYDWKFFEAQDGELWLWFHDLAEIEGLRESGMVDPDYYPSAGTSFQLSRPYFLPDSDPETITLPNEADTNGDGVYDGAEGGLFSGFLNSSFYDGKHQQGEVCPIAGVYVNQAGLFNSRTTNAMMISRAPTEQDLAGHIGRWGNHQSYFVNFGSLDADSFWMTFSDPRLKMTPDRIVRTEIEIGGRHAFTLSSEVPEQNQWLEATMHFAKDGAVVLERTIPIIVTDGLGPVWQEKNRAPFVPASEDGVTIPNQGNTERKTGKEKQSKNTNEEDATYDPRSSKIAGFLPNHSGRYKALFVGIGDNFADRVAKIAAYRLGYKCIVEGVIDYPGKFVKSGTSTDGTLPYLPITIETLGPQGLLTGRRKGKGAHQ